MRSYTLIETVMVIVIIAIVAGIGVPMMLETSDAWLLTSQFQDNAVSSAIVASNRMSQEIRGLRDDSAVVTATATQYSFIDKNNNSLTYNLSGNTLMRNSDGLTDNVVNLAFTYLDDFGNTITTPLVRPNNTDIRRIRVHLSILAGTRALAFRFEVRPQNLRNLDEKFN